jgi:hypothetical protein
MDPHELRARFAELHARTELFLMPNPWDVGSARLLASLGFDALATTSQGFAWSLGRLDQEVSRDELVAHVQELSAAIELPLNVDSERCYPDEPGGVAETVALLAEAGGAGFSAGERPGDAGHTADRRSRGRRRAARLDGQLARCARVRSALLQRRGAPGRRDGGVRRRRTQRRCRASRVSLDQAAPRQGVSGSRRPGG